MIESNQLSVKNLYTFYSILCGFLLTRTLHLAVPRIFRGKRPVNITNFIDKKWINQIYLM